MGCNVQDQSTGTAVTSSATATYGPAIIYPREPKDKTEIELIRDRLDNKDLDFLEIKSDALGFTAFFWLSSVEKGDLEDLQEQDEVDLAYYYEDSRREDYVPLQPPGNGPHPEFQGQRIEHIRGKEYGDDFLVVNEDNVRHGSGVVSKVIGKKLGIATKTTAVILDLKTKKPASSAEEFVWEKILEALLNAADDIATKKRSGKSVVNMSLGFGVDSHIPQAFIDMFGKSCFTCRDLLCAAGSVLMFGSCLQARFYRSSMNSTLFSSQRLGTKPLMKLTDKGTLPSFLS